MCQECRGRSRRRDRRSCKAPPPGVEPKSPLLQVAEGIAHAELFEEATELDGVAALDPSEVVGVGQVGIEARLGTLEAETESEVVSDGNVGNAGLSELGIDGESERAARPAALGVGTTEEEVEAVIPARSSLSLVGLKVWVQEALKSLKCEESALSETGEASAAEGRSLALGLDWKTPEPQMASLEVGVQSALRMP